MRPGDYYDPLPVLRRRLGVERRARILALLAVAPADSAALARALGSVTAKELLQLLRTLRTQGLVEPHGKRDVWRLTGLDQPLARDRFQDKREQRPLDDEPWIKRTAARQIGMTRDPLVAALFGAPAHQVDIQHG